MEISKTIKNVVHHFGSVHITYFCKCKLTYVVLSHFKFIISQIYKHKIINLKLLNCGAGKDSWESLGMQGDQTSHPEGNQHWIFIGRTGAEAEAPIPPDVKSWLIGKDPDAG